MIPVMPVLILSVHPRECSKQGAAIPTRAFFKIPALLTFWKIPLDSIPFKEIGYAPLVLIINFLQF